MNYPVELKNVQRELFNFHFRLYICVGFVAILLLILLARMIYLQVIRFDHYQTLAENNRISVVPVVPTRGMITDRNGEVLAHNYSGYTLEITPSKITRTHKKLRDDMEVLINSLSEIVLIEPTHRKRFYKNLLEHRNFETVMLRSKLTDDEVARLAAQQYRFPGVEIKARLNREYPFGASTAHVVGYIGRINQKDMERLDEENLLSNYRGTDHIGKTGIEQYYEQELHGTTGVEQIEVDSGGRAVRLLSRTPPVTGKTLVLSLDIKLQQIAEKAFGEYRGALVAMDPRNGEVLALVSVPSFDPSLFIDGIDQESWSVLNNSPDHPLNNRVLRGQYPGGSTIKPFMALAGLHYGLRTPSYTISDPGFFSLPGSKHRYRDWRKSGHGSVDLRKSIIISCDTYYYSLAVDMGIERIHSYLTPFGFGDRTNIDLKGESPGLSPTPEWKRKRHKQGWYMGDTVSVGIGQGYSLITPMQLVYATSILANNGLVYKPHLVKATQTAKGEPAKNVPNPPLYRIPIDPAHLEVVKQGMIGVTQPGGTASQAAAGAGYHIAGKTGTAQVITIKQNERYDESRINKRHRDHAWFMGFAPAEEPKIAVVALVENGGHGGSVAAPIVRKVMDYYLLGKIPPEQLAAEKEAAEQHAARQNPTAPQSTPAATATQSTEVATPGAVEGDGYD